MASAMVRGALLRSSSMSDRWIRGHFGDEVRPRHEFIRELEAELATTWPAPAVERGPEPEPEQVQPAGDVDVWVAFQNQSAPAPASVEAPPPTPECPVELPSVESPTPRPPSRRGAWWAVGALALLLGAGLVYVATRDADNASITAPGDTSSGLTTVPGATVEAGAATTEPSGSGTPSSEGVATTVHPTFDPACVEQAASGAMPTIDESGAAALTGLPAVPTLTIRLPTLAHSEYGPGQAGEPDVLRVPGGVLVSVTDYSMDNEFTGTMMAMIGADGGVRWIRCIDSTFVSRTTWDPVQTDVVLLSNNGEASFELSLADGATGPATTFASLEFPRDVEYPALSLARLEDSTLFDVIAVDDAGNELWRDSTLHPRGGESFNADTVDGLGLAAGCEEINADFSCVGPHLRAYDPADGTVRWDIPGVVDVDFIADGLAMVTVEGGEHRQLSLGDGSFLQGAWPQDAFGSECCGGSDYHYNSVEGGVVINANYDVITVWYPASLNLGSHEVSLP